MQQVLPTCAATVQLSNLIGCTTSNPLLYLVPPPTSQRPGIVHQIPTQSRAGAPEAVPGDQSADFPGRPTSWLFRMTNQLAVPGDPPDDFSRGPTSWLFWGTL